MSWRTAALALAISLATPAPAEETDPMRFFVGRTESVGTVKIAIKKPFRSVATGKGEIMSDGSLHLVQRIDDQGQPPKERRWRMRKVGPGRYTGSMSEARGPVTVEEIGGRYRFRFRMEGSVSVEQWLTPSADGRSATSKSIFRKYGILVGRSDAVIRKLN